MFIFSFLGDGSTFQIAAGHFPPPPPPPPPTSTSVSTSGATVTQPPLPPSSVSDSLLALSLPPPPPPPSSTPPPGLPVNEGPLFSHVRDPMMGLPLPPPPPPPPEPEKEQHIIPPPPDLKPVVDKLADYSAKNGEEFENKIKTKGDPRFAFLSPDHLYYPYYLYMKQHYIAEIAKEKARELKGMETFIVFPFDICDGVFVDVQMDRK